MCQQYCSSIKMHQVFLPSFVWWFKINPRVLHGQRKITLPTWEQCVDGRVMSRLPPRRDRDIRCHHIVQLVGVGLDSDFIYILTELMEEKDLKDYLMRNGDRVTEKVVR